MSTTQTENCIKYGKACQNIVPERFTVHSHGLSPPRAKRPHANVRKCGRLPDIVVDADTPNTFKSRLDKHCFDQDVLYNFHSELTGTGLPEVIQFLCNVVKDTGKEEYLCPFIRIVIGLDFRKRHCLVSFVFMNFRLLQFSL